MVSDNNINTDLNGNIRPGTDHNGNEAPHNGANGTTESNGATEANGVTETNGATEANGVTETNGATEAGVGEEKVATYCDLSVCFLCAAPATLVCEKCGLIAACSEKHMKLHR